MVLYSLLIPNFRSLEKMAAHGVMADFPSQLPSPPASNSTQASTCGSKSTSAKTTRPGPLFGHRPHFFPGPHFSKLRRCGCRWWPAPAAPLCRRSPFLMRVGRHPLDHLRSVHTHTHTLSHTTIATIQCPPVFNHACRLATASSLCFLLNMPIPQSSSRRLANTRTVLES